MPLPQTASQSIIPAGKTVDVRQGTGPRATVTVLIVSLLAAAVVGALLLIFFYLGSTPL
jgi:hypothetical protein